MTTFEDRWKIHTFDFTEHYEINTGKLLKLVRLSDAKIVDALQEGGRRENRAIQQLLDENRSKISSYVLKNKGNASDAETCLLYTSDAADD